MSQLTTKIAPLSSAKIDKFSRVLDGFGLQAFSKLSTFKLKTPLIGSEPELTFKFQSANNLGWAIYARGNTYSYGGDTPNKFGISYWDGTNWHTPYFSIMPNGNVGIGSMNPTVAKLQVEVPSSGSPHIGVLVENKDTTTGAASFRLNRNDTSLQNNIVWYTATATPSYQWALGQVSAGTNNLEVARNGLNPLQVWDVNNGNIGINTTTPQTQLDVNGPIRPGSATSGAACTPEGAFAYDSTAHKPLYCPQVVRGLKWVALALLRLLQVRIQTERTLFHAQLEQFLRHAMPK